MERSFSHEIDDKDIQHDVQEMMGQMTEEEKLQARDELLQSLDPSLIAFLQKRSAYKAMKGKDSTPVKETDIPEESTEEVARRVANEIDYSSLKTEDDLDKAVAQLPAAEQEKLKWTLPVSTTENPTEPRFDFNGAILPPSASSTIAVHSGLYNHGNEADLPGYTLSELLLLCRSAVSGQRVLALKCIHNILRCRSWEREFGKKLNPEMLPVTILRVLCMLLERRRGMEEVSLVLHCLEELCSTQEEHYRRLLLNLSYRGYEYAHVQDPASLIFESDCDLGEKDPFREENCGNLFTMLYEAGILHQLFQCIVQFSMHPPVITAAWSLLRVLIESDKRFGEAIIDSHAFFTQIEQSARQLLNPSFLDDSYAIPSSPSLSYRLTAITHYPDSNLSETLHFLTAVEALVRHSRKNASNIARSAVLPAMKQWFSLYLTSYIPTAPTAPTAPSLVTEAVIEGVLSCWRLCLLYGLDVESIDPFFPALLRVVQFAQPANQILAWSLLEISVRTKSTTTSRYFIEFCNTLVLLAVEQGKAAAPPVRTAVTHFLASYVEVVNDQAEQAEQAEQADNVDQSDEVTESLRSQVLQLGYAAMADCAEDLRAVEQSHNAVYKAWADMSASSSEEAQAASTRYVFSPAELTYLRASDACFARSRLALAGIQNSRQFAAMLRDGGWIDTHLAFVTGPLWRDCHATPHSPALTYLSRVLILAQVNWTLLLHAVLPLESRRLAEGAGAIAATGRARVWGSAWRLIELLLPGDEYVALELLVHVLLDPVSVKCYCEGRSEAAALNVDLDCVTACLVQQLGEGRLVEHSQSLSLTNYADRHTLLLLPFHIEPSLPLLPHWLLMPLFLLRFHDTPAMRMIRTEAEALAFLTFLWELETSPCKPLREEDKAMRCFGLLHLVFAEHEVIFSETVQDSFWKLMGVYGVDPIACHCTEKVDAIQGLAAIVPVKEVTGFLERCCNRTTEECYGCSFLLRVLLLFIRPCREWSYRVTVLNYFLDQDYAAVLLRAAAETAWGDRVAVLLKEKEAREVVDTLYEEYARDYRCVWEEKEEVIEMILRYMEQAIRHVRSTHPEVVVNPLSFWVKHYVEKERPHYAFIMKEYDKMWNMLFKEWCVCSYCQWKELCRVNVASSKRQLKRQ